MKDGRNVGYGRLLTVFMRRGCRHLFQFIFSTAHSAATEILHAHNLFNLFYY